MCTHTHTGVERRVTTQNLHSVLDLLGDRHRRKPPHVAQVNTGPVQRVGQLGAVQGAQRAPLHLRRHERQRDVPQKFRGLPGQSLVREELVVVDARLSVKNNTCPCQL